MPGEKIYKVFVSSTYEDLRVERAEVQKALLRLKCLPVGMELFPAADEEAWEFIKRQIEDSDYYIVIVAGRYGGVTKGGRSYTEMEYDYAQSIGKPSIGFVHKDVESIPSRHSERSRRTREKLAAFRKKIMGHLVAFFSTPHELALEVMSSFPGLVERRPAVGFVRSNEAVEYKKYSEALEENNSLRQQLKSYQEVDKKQPFTNSKRIILLDLTSHNGEARTARRTLGDLFRLVCNSIFDQYVPTEHNVRRDLAKYMTPREHHRFDIEEHSWRAFRTQLLIEGLIEVSHMGIENIIKIPEVRQKVLDMIRTMRDVNELPTWRISNSPLWKITDHGQKELTKLTSTPYL